MTSAVVSAVTIISRTIDSLPPRAYLQVDGGRIEVLGHPVCRLLVRPNSFQGWPDATPRRVVWTDDVLRLRDRADIVLGRFALSRAPTVSAAAVKQRDIRGRDVQKRCETCWCVMVPGCPGKRTERQHLEHWQDTHEAVPRRQDGDFGGMWKILDPADNFGRFRISFRPQIRDRENREAVQYSAFEIGYMGSFDVHQQ